MKLFPKWVLKSVGLGIFIAVSVFIFSKIDMTADKSRREKPLKRQVKSNQQKISNKKKNSNSLVAELPGNFSDQSRIKLNSDFEISRAITDTDNKIPTEAVMRIGRENWKNGKSISSMFFTADDKYLIAGSSDKTISWWDLETGKAVKRINNWGPVGQLFPVPEKNLFISVEAFKPILLFRDILNGNVIQRIISAPSTKSNMRTKPVLAISKTGQNYALQTANFAISTYNEDFTTSIRMYEGLEESAKKVWFSQYSSTINAISASGKYVSWDLSTGEILKQSSLEKFENCSVSPDEKTLASISNRGFRIWNLEDGSLLDKRAWGGNSIACSPDGKFIIIGTYFGVIKVWDVEKKSVVSQSNQSFSSITAIAFSYKGDKFATADYLGTIKLWNASNLKELNPDEFHKGEIKSLSFTRDGKKLISLASDNEIRLWNLENASQTAKYSLASYPRLIRAISESEALLIHNHGAKIWEIETGKVIRSLEFSKLQFPGYLQAHMAVSNDGDFFAVSLKKTGAKKQDSEHALVFRTSDLVMVRSFPLPALFGGMSFSPDNSRLAITANEKNRKEVICQSLLKDSEISRTTIPTKMGYISIPIYTANGELLVCGGSYGKHGRAFEKTENNEVVYFPWCIAVIPNGQMASPDGKIFASLSWSDRSVIEIGVSPLLDSPTLKLQGHRGAINASAFSPGGRYLATGGKDANILIWDLYSGEDSQIIPAGPEQQKISAESTSSETSADLHFSFEGNISSPGFSKTILHDTSFKHTFASGKSSLALNFNSAERESILIGDTESINFAGDWTAEFWYKLSEKDDWQKHDYLRLIDCGLFAFVIAQKGVPVIFYKFAGRGGHGSSSPLKGKPAKPGIWHHVALVFEKETGRFEIFHDGQQTHKSLNKDIASNLGELSFGRGSFRPDLETHILLDDLRFHSFTKNSLEIAKEAGFAESPDY